MLGEGEFYSGVVLSRIVRESQQQLTFGSLSQLSGLVFTIDGLVALFIKYSSNRLSPWGFTFTADQVKQIQLVQKSRLEPVIALVCHEDGIAAVAYDEFVSLIGAQIPPTGGWVRAVRQKRHGYGLKGSQAELKNKVSLSDLWPKISLAMELAHGRATAQLS
jgi:hypothetical protein